MPFSSDMSEEKISEEKERDEMRDRCSRPWSWTKIDLQLSQAHGWITALIPDEKGIICDLLPSFDKDHQRRQTSLSPFGWLIVTLFPVEIRCHNRLITSCQDLRGLVAIQDRPAQIVLQWPARFRIDDLGSSCRIVEKQIVVITQSYRFRSSFNQFRIEPIRSRSKKKIRREIVVKEIFGSGDGDVGIVEEQIAFRGRVNEKTTTLRPEDLGKQWTTQIPIGFIQTVVSARCQGQLSAPSTTFDLTHCRVESDRGENSWRWMKVIPSVHLQIVDVVDENNTRILDTQRLKITIGIDENIAFTDVRIFQMIFSNASAHCDSTRSDIVDRFGIVETILDAHEQCHCTRIVDRRHKSTVVVVEKIRVLVQWRDDRSFRKTRYFNSRWNIAQTRWTPSEDKE